jgi:hypothetical protein
MPYKVARQHDDVRILIQSHPDRALGKLTVAVAHGLQERR